MHTTTRLAGQVIRDGCAAARVAHAALFERILARVERYLQRLIWDPEEAAECVQQTLVVLEESLQSGTYDPDRSFNGWVWLKARTCYAQWCRDRQRRRGEPLDPARLVDPTDPHEAVDRRLDAAAVLRRLARELGPDTYEAFVLYYESGLTLAEVGQTLARDRKTVSRMLAAAHREIARQLPEPPA